jgi:hypothetical protein
MATVRREITTRATPASAWDAIRDVGALHTRLVPGFVVDTRVEGDARVVTFASGLVVTEPIVTVDEEERRLVWGAIGGPLTHYNGAVQVFPDRAGSRVVWTADFLPNDSAPVVASMIEQGMAAMKRTLDGHAP